MATEPTGILGVVQTPFATEIIAFTHQRAEITDVARKSQHVILIHLLRLFQAVRVLPT